MSGRRLTRDALVIVGGVLAVLLGILLLGVASALIAYPPW